jgi:hypothetical protein
LDGDQTRVLHEEALTIARSIGDDNLRAEGHYVLAIDAIAVGDTRVDGGRPPTPFNDDQTAKQPAAAPRREEPSSKIRTGL